ncbi:hypothetical protein ABT009_11970 [Streptomyces sp. NPDC002896]|uniref:hypothetical protein n=1 Tax=Streptomyces sp. NPDC002896 TaxID=3154438 RepID=UPI00332CB5A2
MPTVRAPDPGAPTASESWPDKHQGPKVVGVSFEREITLRVVTVITAAVVG